MVRKSGKISHSPLWVPLPYGSIPPSGVEPEHVVSMSRNSEAQSTPLGKYVVALELHLCMCELAWDNVPGRVYSFYVFTFVFHGTKYLLI